MTDVEKQFVDNVLPGRKWNDRQVAELLKLMKFTAYHEAGHVVARAFTGLEFHHIRSVSIIPNEQGLGRETSERNLTELTFSKEWPRADGYRLMLALLAGHCAESSQREDKNWLDDSFDEEVEEPDTDWCRVQRIARLMATPKYPPSRIVRSVLDWTLEMLRVPPVSNAVENLAELLLKKGDVESREELSTICKEADFLAFRLPVWKRRLSRRHRKKAK